MKRLLFLLLGIQAATLSLTAHTFLQVICEPGVEIFLDGTPIGTSNWKDSGFHTAISPGEYLVEAKKDGFETQAKRISLRKSDVSVWQLEPLTPVPGAATSKEKPRESDKPGFGSLTVYSHPTNCTVTLVTAARSEASWPKTGKKWTAKQLPAGKYTVKATRRGKTLSYDLEIPPGGQAELIFDFRRDRAHLYNVSFEDGN